MNQHSVLLVFSLMLSGFGNGQLLAQEVKQKIAKPPLRIGVVLLKNSTQLQTIAAILKKCMELSGQTILTISPGKRPEKKQDITHFHERHDQFVIFIDESGQHKEKAVSIRLYDTIDALMLSGKRLVGLDIQDKRSLKGLYTFIQELWLDIMGQQGPFRSLISYIKRTKNSAGRTESAICVCSPDGFYQDTIITVPGAYLGLYWHPQQPRLYCSEFARFNVRLVSFDLNGNKRIVLDKAGTSAGVSLNLALHKVAYCRSGSLWLYEFDGTHKKGIHRKVISNEGKNMYPILLDNGDVIFSSDAQSLKTLKFPENIDKTRPVKSTRRIPGIYRYQASKQTVVPLITNGFAIAPALHAASSSLAYAKKVAGILQLFTYNLQTQQTRQLTSGPGHKIDPSWSSCGKYIAFTHQHGKKSRVAILQLAQEKIEYLTSVSEYCSSPAWSYNIS